MCLGGGATVLYVSWRRSHCIARVLEEEPLYCTCLGGGATVSHVQLSAFRLARNVVNARIKKLASNNIRCFAIKWLEIL